MNLYLCVNGVLLTEQLLEKNAKLAEKHKLMSAEIYKTKVRNTAKIIDGYEIIEGKKHSILCSHARKDDCDCWCQGKYHKNTKGCLTLVTDGISKENES